MKNNVLVKQFLISIEDGLVWQVVSLEPQIEIKKAGTSNETKKLDQVTILNHLAVDVSSAQHRAIVRMIEFIKDRADEVSLKWSEKEQHFEFIEVSPVCELSLLTELKKFSESPLTEEELIKQKKRNLAMLKEIKSLAKNKKENDELSRGLQTSRRLDSKEETQIQEDFIVIEPSSRYSLENIILPGETKLQLEKVITRLELGDFLNNEWGLSEITEHKNRQPVNFQGPPGTGKTLAAKCIGTKLNQKILQVDYSQLFSKWVGETGKNIQRVFQKAKKENLILFFDEADALLSSRVSDSSDKHNQTNQNIFMQELDRFDGIVILTTNHFENYDEAILRRFSHVEFKLPDSEQRESLFKRHLPSKIKAVLNFNWSLLTQSSEGFSGGDIKNVMEQGLVNKLTKLRQSNPSLSSEEFKTLLRGVEFCAEDFIEEVNSIRNTKKSYLKGGSSSSPRSKMTLVSQ